MELTQDEFTILEIVSEVGEIHYLAILGQIRDTAISIGKQYISQEDFNLALEKLEDYHLIERRKKLIDPERYFITDEGRNLHIQSK